MTRRTWLIGGLAAAAAGLGAGGFLWREARHAEATGGLWNLQLPQPDGRLLALAELRGRPLLLNFWATWCAPCVREMPMLDRFAADQPPDGWRVLGLAIDNAEAVRGFLGRTPVRFPIVLGGAEGLNLARALGNAAGGLPFSVGFDARGRPTQRKLGELTPEELQAWVRDA